MAGKTSQDLFQQFNVDMRDQREILAERARRNMEAAMTSEYQERYPGDAGLQQAGAALGTALSNKFNNKLTEKQAREQAAAKQARNVVSKQVEAGLHRGANGEVDPVKRAHALQKEVAKALVRQRDPRGVQMLIQIGELERQQEKDDLEREGIVLRNDAQRDADRKREYEFGRLIENEMKTVWPIDTTDPNDRADLYIDANGNARNPTTMDVVYPAGSWSRVAPIRPELVRGAVAGDLTDEQKALLPSKRELGQIRRRERDVMTSMELGIGITDAMKSAVNEDGSLTIMSTGGKISAGALKIFDNLVAAGRGLADTIVIENADGTTQTHGSSKGAAIAYARSHPGVFAGVDYSRFGIDRTDSRAVDQINAIFVQYAYAKARLNEENGRISDVDFEHAIQQIAANATDPESLRRVLTGDVERSVREYEQWIRQMHPSILRLVRTKEAADAFDALEEKWKGAFDKSFGTPTNVGPGLLPTAAPADGEPLSVDQWLNGGFNSREDFLDSLIIKDDASE